MCGAVFFSCDFLICVHVWCHFLFMRFFDMCSCVVRFSFHVIFDMCSCVVRFSFHVIF